MRVSTYILLLISGNCSINIIIVVTVSAKCITGNCQQVANAVNQNLRGYERSATVINEKKITPNNGNDAHTLSVQHSALARSVLDLSECTNGQIAVQLIRTCGYFAEEESFEIYEKTGDNLGNPIYSQTACQPVTELLCLNPVQYTVIVRDNIDQWDDDSNLVLTNGDTSLTFAYRGISTTQNEFNALDFASQPPITESPTTQAPTTQVPTTQAPTAQVPTTQPPTTQTPTT